MEPQRIMCGGTMTEAFFMKIPLTWEPGHITPALFGIILLSVKNRKCSSDFADNSFFCLEPKAQKTTLLPDLFRLLSHSFILSQKFSLNFPANEQ